MERNFTKMEHKKMLEDAIVMMRGIICEEEQRAEI